MVAYPNQIDTSSTLPKIVDKQTYVNAAAVNPLRDAILAIENELGTNPSGIYGSLKERFETVEDKFNLISDLQSKVEELETLYDNINSDQILENLELFEVQLNSLAEDFSVLETRFDNFIDSSDISIALIENDISIISSNVSDLESEINGLSIPEPITALVNGVEVASNVSAFDFIGSDISHSVVDGYKVELTFASSGGGSLIYFDNFGGLPAADAEAIKLQIATSTSSQIYSAANLDGAIGAGTMFPARVITVSATSASGTYTGSINIHGKNINDETISETLNIVFTNGGFVLQTWKAFKQVTSIEVSAQNNTNGFLSFGINNRVGLSELPKQASTYIPILQLYVDGIIEPIFSTIGTALSPPNGCIEFTNSVPDGFIEFMAIYVLDS